jgi:hypothetical protein
MKVSSHLRSIWAKFQSINRFTTITGFSSKLGMALALSKGVFVDALLDLGFSPIAARWIGKRALLSVRLSRTPSQKCVGATGFGCCSAM